MNCSVFFCVFNVFIHAIFNQYLSSYFLDLFKNILAGLENAWISYLFQHINPSPRVAVQNALKAPHDYLQVIWLFIGFDLKFLSIKQIVETYHKLNQLFDRWNGQRADQTIRSYHTFNGSLDQTRDQKPNEFIKTDHN